MHINPTDLISVVIPTRNRCTRLIRAVQSVQVQENVSIEIIIVDDASTDDTKHVTESLMLKDTRIRYVRNQYPLGGGGARNVGIKASEGTYVAFLDDDDIWEVSKLSKQYQELVKSSRAVAVSCGFKIIREGLKKTRTVKIKSIKSFQELLLANTLGGASVCFTTKNNLNLINGFDSTLESGQDWDLWIKLLGLGEIRVFEEPLVQYVVHADARITGNPRAEYRGRRTIHLRYKSKMTKNTRKISICEIQFLRQVIFKQTMLEKTKGIAKIIKSVKGLKKIQFFYRFLKHLRRLKKERFINVASSR
jgi:glycosyltransferase involved in cell wall biosynthesis